MGVNNEEKPAPPRWMLTIIAALVVGGASSGLLAWRDLAVLNANIQPFISAGPRFTANDGARLEKRVEELEHELRNLQREYDQHVAWGKQWVKGTEYRLQRMDGERSKTRGMP
jgi:hypothetical protein